MADTDQVLNLAAIIREVDGTHSKGAASLAESILNHPDFRAALADEPAVPQGREPAAVTGQPSDGEVAELVAWLRSNALTVKKASGNPANGARQRMNRAAELLQQMEDLAADAVAGLRYIEESCGRLYGVGWDRVYGKADRLKPAHALPLPEVSE